MLPEKVKIPQTNLKYHEVKNATQNVFTTAELDLYLHGFSTLLNSIFFTSG
jgi:hypothetical protein